MHFYIDTDERNHFYLFIFCTYLCLFVCTISLPQLRWLLIPESCFLLFSSFFVFCLILFYFFWGGGIRLGFIFQASFLHSLPQYTGSCADCGHTRFVTLSLFCSSLLLFSSLAPSLLSWVAVLGHGGAVADFCMRGLSNFYSDSKKRIRTSYQSKSRLSETPTGATQQQGDKAQTMGCHLSKICCFDEVYQVDLLFHVIFSTRYYYYL